MTEKNESRGFSAPRRKKYDLLPKLFCIIGAFVLWLYVTQVETSDYKETFNGITVELVNTSVLESEAGLHVYSGHGNTVNVTVSGKKSDINRYNSDSILVYADVSGITEAGKHTVRVTAETPSGLTVSEMSLSAINVYVDEQSTVEVDVRPKISSAIIGEGCELGELSSEYSLVSVTGPRTVINGIDYAQISLDLGQVNSSISTIGALQLVGKSDEMIDMRYVQLSRTEMKVNVPVYTTKDVSLKVDYKYGYYNKDNVKITFNPETVRIKGDPKELEKISSVTVGTLNEKAIASDVMQVYILNLPSGVSSVDNVETVNVTVTHVGTTVKTFSVNNIEILGSDKTRCEIQTKTLSVRLRGTEAALEKIKSDDITATVNLSEYGNNVSGTVTVNSEITVSGANGSVYSVGDYPVQIKIG